MSLLLLLFHYDGDRGLKVACAAAFNVQSTEALMYRAEKELDSWAKEPARVTDGLQDMLLELYNYAVGMPLETVLEDDALMRSAHELLEFLSQVLRIFQPEEALKTAQSHRVKYFIHALITAAGAMSPLCRLHEVCVSAKAPLALWRFAMASADDHYGEGGIGQWFFDEIRPFLPRDSQWHTPWQCPPQFEQGLEARAVWPLEALPEGSAARRLFLALRAGAKEVAEELRTGVLSEQGQAFIKDPAWSGLHMNGQWMALTLYRTEGYEGRGQAQTQLDPMHCRLVPRTCRLLQEAGVPPGMAAGLPRLQGGQEVVDFLRADPGTVVVFHTAKTNGRLTVQLCLTGCNDDQSGGSYIQVGPERVYWRFGEPVVFDDSFMHSVRIDPTIQEPRWVLSVQVMHPAIDSAEGFANHFSGRPAREGDAREQQEPTAPPALVLGSGPAADAFPAEALTFHNSVGEPVLLYAALWGPDGDGPEVLVGEAPDLSIRPLDGGRGLVLPPLAHRTRLAARNVTDGTELVAWRVDAGPGGRRRFELPVSAEELAERGRSAEARQQEASMLPHWRYGERMQLILSRAHKPLTEASLRQSMSRLTAA